MSYLSTARRRAPRDPSSGPRGARASFAATGGLWDDLISSEKWLIRKITGNETMPTSKAGTSAATTQQAAAEVAAAAKQHGGDIVPPAPMGPTDYWNALSTMASSGKKPKPQIPWLLLGIGAAGVGGYFLWKKSRSA